MVSYLMLRYVMIWYVMIWFLMLWYGILCDGMVWYGLYVWMYVCMEVHSREISSAHIMQASPQRTVDTERAVLQDQASRRTTCQQLLPQNLLTRQTVCSRNWSAVCFVAHILWSRPMTQIGRLWRRRCIAIWCDARNTPTYIINTSIQFHSCMQYAHGMSVLFSDVCYR